MLDLTALNEIADLDIPALHYEPWLPVTPPRLAPADPDEEADIFAAIRQGDVLLHHPYESFTASVQRFIEQAAEDPDVLSIKQTLYRTSGDSPIVKALIEAAEAGKQVVCLVEIKARFDERANIVWARALERAGAHVAYGLVGLKTHSKLSLVVRREGRGLRRYVHIGTGNYNPKTARIYVDLGLLTADSELGADVTDLFNLLTGHSRQKKYRKLLVAPEHVALGDHRSHRPRARAATQSRRWADRDEVQLGRRSEGHGRALQGERRWRRDRSHRPRNVRRPAGRGGREREHPRPIDRRPLPGTLADLRLRPRRPRALLHRLGGHHGAQPRPARRGDHARRRSGKPGRAAHHHRGDAQGRSTGVGARPGRPLAAASRRSWTSRPVSTRSRRSWRRRRQRRRPPTRWRSTRWPLATRARSSSNTPSTIRPPSASCSTASSWAVSWQARGARFLSAIATWTRLHARSSARATARGFDTPVARRF